MKPWTEHKEDTRIRIAFTGIDGDARDKAEIERFKSELETPAGNDTATPEGGIVRYRYRGASGIPHLGVGGLVGLVAGGFLLWLAAVASSWPIGFLAAPLLGYVLWKLIRGLRGQAPIGSKAFTVVFEPGVLRVETASGPTTEYPLDRIAQFEGGSRLVIVQKDGTRETLKPVLGTRVDTTELACRLDEGLMEARRWSGGYR